MLAKGTMAKRKAVPPTPAEVTAITPHFDDFPDIADVLPDLAVETRSIQAQIAKLEKRKKEIAGEIDVLLEAVDSRAIRGDTWIAVRVEGAWLEKVVPELLLVQGVTLDQIEGATVKTQNAGYVQVRGLKEGK